MKSRSRYSLLAPTP